MFKCTKKIAFAAVTVFTAAALGGCSGKLPFGTKTVDFDKSYVVTADITCDKLEAKADVTRLSDSDWEFTFTEPKELNGITLHFGEKGYTAYLGGLSFDADGRAGYVMLPEIIADTVDSLANCTSENFVQKDGILTADLDYNGKKVTVTAHDKTGELISLKCPYHKLSVAFSGQHDYVSELPEDGGLIIRE